MSYRTLERLERLRTLNSNRQWVNHDVYRLMYKEDLYILACERIKSKPGNMTPGTDEETLDGFSLEAIREMIREMKTEQFRFKPVRQQFIPKPNGKMRKLGIPCVRDKIVQEVIRLILEAIYDSPRGPYFSDSSHGFRPQRSCHTALREFREKWTGVNWLIEGDIRACFDELEHRTLVSLLHKKIQDERFLNLIWKLLNAGYMDLHGMKKDSLIGSPQGGIASPILANVYLHELDEFVETLRSELEKGQEKRRDPVYRQLSKKKARLAARGKTRTKEFKDVTKRMRATPSRQVSAPNYIRIRYLRYADDWLVGVGGSHALAEAIKQKIKAFLSDHLHLTPSRGKNAHHQCALRRSLLPRDTPQDRQRRQGEAQTDDQLDGKDVQTSLHRMGNGDERSTAQTRQEIERQRILLPARRTDSQVWMGVSRCRSDRESVQQREPRHPELLSFHR
jgi:group II intron reverse transcriptase/maturase